uniref:CLOCK-interacting pacemaker n=1 Tax=Oreochromis niloticus TaxID=8128 RepID=A0A669EN24_ORENI
MMSFRMLKEQEPYGEHNTHSASKNAKDKSNSATLWASQGGTHRVQSGMGDKSTCMLYCDSEKDSEKDSGYSEAGSDSVHTDVDDQRSSVNESHRESRKCSNNNNANPAGPDMTSYENIPPVCLVLKPSGSGQLLHGPLGWGGSWHSLTSGKTPTQVFLIQQPTIYATSSCAPTPSFCLPPPQGQFKEGSSCSNQNHSKNSYLPILNSYPHIAPHPRKKIHEGKGIRVDGVKELCSEGQSQSKRACIEEEKREAVSTTIPLLQQQQKDDKVHFQHKVRGGHPPPILSLSHCLLPSYASSKTQHKSRHCHKNSSSENLGSLSILSSHIPSSPSSFSPLSSSPSSSSPTSSTAHSPYHLALDSSSTRQRRFHNTAEILNQLGLLAITLCTKELLKQNVAIETEITQLRQHTHLLSQASQNSGTEVSHSLDKLFQIMRESGAYPNLVLSDDESLSSSHQKRKTIRLQDYTEDNTETSKMQSSLPQVVSIHNMNDGTSLPSPLFAPSPDTKEADHAYSSELMSLSLFF